MNTPWSRAGVCRLGISLLAAAVFGCAGPDEGAVREATVHRVLIKGFTFEPANLEVAAGDTIVWINQDVVPHTATSQAGGWDTGNIPAGGESKVAVTATAAGDYICTFHPTMVGVLQVR